MVSISKTNNITSDQFLANFGKSLVHRSQKGEWCAKQMTYVVLNLSCGRFSLLLLRMTDCMFSP